MRTFTVQREDSVPPRSGRRLGFLLVLLALALLGSLGALSAAMAEARYERDVARMVFNDNLELLEDARRSAGRAADSLSGALAASTDPSQEDSYIVISIAEHRLWYKKQDQVVFSTRVATGSGKVLAKNARKSSDKDSQWKFETPRGRLVVQSKETDPAWVPPDWHYVEVGQKKKAQPVQLKRGAGYQLSDGSTIIVDNTDIVRRYPDGRDEVLEGGDGLEIIADGKLFIPPFGTSHRRFQGVLGSHRLNMGDGYALHGTNAPNSIGRSVSHGCVRLRNEDIETLYQLVPVGTPVYIY
ncbi:MAG TPA: L,D-transpeptidase [Gemmatimonadaceae bacterium]|nr:L,D-transpeptidase [Gemmatimonadaceae bacterium]